jgi:hypothetical protein
VHVLHKQDGKELSVREQQMLKVQKAAEAGEAESKKGNRAMKLDSL